MRKVIMQSIYQGR